MKKFDVEITETLQRTVSVEADSRAEAERLVTEAWNNEDYVLDSTDFVGVDGGNAAFSLCESAAQFAPIGFAYRLFLRRRVTACRIFAKQKCKEIPARHGVRLCSVGYRQGY